MAYTEETLRKVLDRMQKDGEVDCYGNYDTDDGVCADCDFRIICKTDTLTAFAAEPTNTDNPEEGTKMAKEQVQENEVTREDFEEMDEEELLETCEELEVEAVYTGKGKKKKLDKEATIDLLVEAISELEDGDLEEEDEDGEDDSEEDSEDGEEEGSEESDEEDEDESEEGDDEEEDDEDLTREDLEEMEDDDLVEIAEELELEVPYTGKGKKKKLDREALIEAVLSLEDGEEDEEDDSDEDDSDDSEDEEDEPEEPKKPAKGKDKAKDKQKPKDKEAAKDKPKRAPRNTDGPSIESIIVDELKVGGTVNDITERVEPLLKKHNLECKDVKMRVRRSTHYAAQLEGFYMHKDESGGRGKTYYQLVEEGKKPAAQAKPAKKK